MEPREPDYDRALKEAERFLGRWRDGFTSRVREDVAQEAVIESWMRRANLRDAGRFLAYVRTVARRLRYQRLVQERARAMQSIDADERLASALETSESGRPTGVLVDGDWVDRRWLLSELRAVLARLSVLNRGLLRGYYGGASTRDLATRHDLSVSRVKARLHRGRHRLRREFIECVRRARHADSGTAGGRTRPLVSNHR